MHSLHMFMGIVFVGRKRLEIVSFSMTACCAAQM